MMNTFERVGDYQVTDDLQSAKAGVKNSQAMIVRKNDEIVVNGIGSEGGYKSPVKFKWNSTH